MSLLRRLGAAVLGVAALAASVRPARASIQPRCRVEVGQEQVRIPMPRRGFERARGYDGEGACDPVPARRWIRGAAGAVDLLVDAAGPEGSGRYWAVTVGVADRRGARPSRGVCLLTNTVGWRTLQKYKPLVWLADTNGDGIAEVVIWSSFSARDDDPASEYGLTARVYSFDGDALSLDWDLTRRFAKELAASYRLPIRSDPDTLRARERAASALEAFAEERCAAAVGRKKKP